MKPLLVECIGLPGSGKTTIAEQSLRELHARGISVRANRSLEREAGVHAQEHRARNALWHIVRNPKLIFLLSGLCMRLQNAIYAYKLFRICVITHMDLATKADVILYDQGVYNFLLTAVSRNQLKCVDATRIGEYLSKYRIPTPSILIHIKTPVDTSFERMVSRAKTHPLQSESAEAYQRMAESYDTCARELVNRCRKKSACRFATLHGEKNSTLTAHELTETITEAMVTYHGKRTFSILFLTTTYKLSGAEKMLGVLAAHLHRKGHTVSVGVLKSEHGELAERLDRIGISHFSLGIDTVFGAWKLVSLARAVKNMRPDIVQSFLFFDNVAGILLGRALRVPVVIAGIRNVNTEQSAVRSLAERLLLPRSHAIVSNTSAGKEYYARSMHIPGERMHVVHNCIVPSAVVHTTRMKGNMCGTTRTILGVPINSDEYAICSIGRLTEQKGLEFLIEALAKLHAAEIRVHSFIIGDGKLRRELVERARSRGISTYVHFVGHLPNAEQHILQFDAYVLPSLWEGMPNAVMEAMAQKIPVVATRVGGVPELLTDSAMGRLVPPKDIGALAESIRSILTQGHTQKEKMLDAAYKHISTFTEERMVNAYERLYLSKLQ